LLLLVVVEVVMMVQAVVAVVLVDCYQQQHIQFLLDPHIQFKLVAAADLKVVDLRPILVQ
jgi:hypothetical protein